MTEKDISLFLHKRGFAVLMLLLVALLAHLQTTVQLKVSLALGGMVVGTLIKLYITMVLVVVAGMAVAVHMIMTLILMEEVEAEVADIFILLVLLLIIHLDVY